MKIRTSLMASTAALFLASAAVSWGGTITITNPSFENPSCGTQSTIPLACGAPTGWTQGGNDLAATFLPATTDAQAESGLQYAYVDGGADLFQALSATLQANTDYTLDVWVLNRTNPGPSGFCPGCTFDPQVALFAGATLLGDAVGATPAVGQWAEWTITYDSGTTDPGLGQGLSIYLATASNQNQGDFDNISLTGNSTTTGVPEPSTFMFAGAGLLGLGFAARRRLTR